MDRLASQVIIDILASEMGFGSSNIWIRDQNKKIPNDDGFKIMRLPNSFINSSVAEGGSQLNRYSITVGCMVLYEKIKILNPDNGDYYDDFDTRVDDEKTIGEIDGLIEFNITGD